jgi:asparagine synthetase B (glutamine-hydrolysing)
LAIVGVDSGAQPLTNNDGTVTLCVNGEIYNHSQLRQRVIEKRQRENRPAPVFKTGSDCEVILHLVAFLLRSNIIIINITFIILFLVSCCFLML